MRRRALVLLVAGPLVIVALPTPAGAARDDCKLKSCVWDAPGFSGQMETPQGKSGNCANFPVRSAANQYPPGPDKPWLRIYGGADCKGPVVAELRPGEARDVSGRSAGGGIS